jgi:hypothetical protein
MVAVWLGGKVGCEMEKTQKKKEEKDGLHKGWRREEQHNALVFVPGRD